MNNTRYTESQKTIPSNEKKKMEKAISGDVKTKPKTPTRKFAEVFISQDIANVKEYVIMDVIIPAIKNTIEDIVTNGIRMILRGDTASRTNNGTRANTISYNKVSSSRPVATTPAYTRYSYDDIILTSRGDAETVLDRMAEAIETYDVVSVGDLYDIVGKSSNYTDYKYGWTSIRTAEVIRVRDGYKIKLPVVSPINK